MPTQIDREQVLELVKAGARLVEVLPTAEFDEEHLPGAISIPLGKIDAYAGDRLRLDAPVIVYCADYT